MSRFPTRSAELETTVPPSTANVMETKTPLLIQDRKSTKVDAGHLYGFMIIFNNPQDSIRLLSPAESGFEADALHPIAPFEYFFTVPPRSIGVTEPGTVQIQPTLGRNYLVEHQGSLLKQLTISGTTGFRPNAGFQPAGAVRGFSQVFGRTTRAQSNVYGALQQLVSNPNFRFDARGIAPAEPTGYFNFMQLRNVFRRYFSLRAGGGGRRGVQQNLVPLMLWVNFHEFEFWICEPTSFTTRRESRSPLTFSYDIAASLLIKADSIQLRSMDWYQRLVEDRYLNLVLDTVTGLNNLVRTFALLPGAIVGDAVGLTNEFFSVATDTATTVSEVVRTGRNLLEVDDTKLALLGSRANDTAQAWDDALADIDGIRNKYLTFERSNTFKDSIRISNRLRALRRDQQTSGAGAGAANIQLQQAQRAYSGSGPGPESAVSSDAPNRPKRLNRNYGEPGDVRNIRALAQPPLDRDRVRGGEDIRGLAQRVLGEAARWKELVILNGLVFPYISPVGGQGILKPGDEILVPGSSEGVGNDNLVFPTDASDFGANVGEISPEDVVFGRDLKVSFTGYNDAGGLKIDLNTTPNGDIALVSGRANFEQAMILVTNTELGTLKLHPFYGFPRLVGKKISHSITALWSIEAKQALAGDPRVESIADIGFGVVGDVFLGRLDVISRRSLARIPVTTVQRM